MKFNLVENAWNYGFDTEGNAMLYAESENSSSCASISEGKMLIDYYDGEGNITEQKEIELYDLDKTENAPTFEDAILLLRQINENKNNKCN